MIIMVRKEKKCNLCTRIKVLPISPVRTVGVFQIWLYAHYELKSCAINICPVNIVGTDSQSVLNMMPVRGTSPTLGDSTNNSRFRFVGADPLISPDIFARSGERALHF